MTDTITDISTARARRVQPSPPRPGTIRTTASDVGDDVYVTLNDASRTVRRGPVAWSPRLDALPVVGSPCYVVQATDGRWIVIHWEPLPGVAVS